jgi:hypothetical protein
MRLRYYNPRMDAASLNLTTKVLGYGRFLFIELDASRVDASLLQEMAQAASGLENAHDADGNPGADATARGRIQYLRGEPSRLRKGDVEDEGVVASRAAVRLEGNDAAPLVAYESRLRALIAARAGRVHTHAGVRKDRSYTSHAMSQYAYANALAPAPAVRQPLGIFLPQRKTREWWEMDWMRRESFFLPRYTDDGKVAAEGHAAACAEGIPHLQRRLYHHPDGYGLDYGYDFLGYFELAETDEGVFDRVMKRLRDREQNPEWKYVREGPEWWARRVRSPEALWR